MAMLAITAAIEIGSLIYRLVDRPSTPKPSLVNLQISNAQSGAPIPFGYGTCRFAGQVLWTPGITFRKVNGSKKGGPSVVSYTYFANFAVGFGEGPSTISRMWGDSKLIYDANPQASSTLDASNYDAWDPAVTYNPGATVGYGGVVYEAIVLSTNQIPVANGSIYWLQIGATPYWNMNTAYNPGDVVTWFNGALYVAMNSNTNVQPPNSVWSQGNPNNDWVLMSSYYPAPAIYPGNETQTADPLIQASEGTANVSANRGLCYTVFDTMPLQNFGGRIPNIRAEVTFTKVAPVL
ncbi:MAG TPA: hypothetical protein VH022_14390 [Candidatus Acidoferrum sp.]|jgi:hypothetical protein|nr:hypothetical protein [Candidatus Acidoferrum sp.]